MAKMLTRLAGRAPRAATDALDRRILSAARRQFINQGYAAASIEKIAVEARAGKPTIYRRFGSKESLFAAVLAEMVETTFESSRAQASAADPLSQLRDSLLASLDLLAWPQSLALYRILIAEARRFPALIERVRLASFGPLRDKRRRLLDAARQAGQLRDDCPADDLLHALDGLVTGWLTSERLLGRGALATPAERQAYFDFAWSLFLEGAGPRRIATGVAA